MEIANMMDGEEEKRIVVCTGQNKTGHWQGGVRCYTREAIQQVAACAS